MKTLAWVLIWLVGIDLIVKYTTTPGYALIGLVLFSGGLSLIKLVLVIKEE